MIFALAPYTNNKNNCWNDIKAAFLEVDMDKDVYIEWPEGVLEKTTAKARRF